MYKLPDTIQDISLDVLGIVIGAAILASPEIHRRVIGEYGRRPVSARMKKRRSLRLTGQRI
jgi:hypothetical protein